MDDGPIGSGDVRFVEHVARWDLQCKSPWPRARVQECVDGECNPCGVAVEGAGDSSVLTAPVHGGGVGNFEVGAPAGRGQHYRRAVTTVPADDYAAAIAGTSTREFKKRQWLEQAAGGRAQERTHDEICEPDNDGWGPGISDASFPCGGH